jgi:hypothetical protein
MDIHTKFKNNYFSTGIKDVGKGVEFGSTPDNCICLNVSEAFLKDPLCAYMKLHFFDEFGEIVKLYFI